MNKWIYSTNESGCYGVLVTSEELEKELSAVFSDGRKGKVKELSIPAAKKLISDAKDAIKKEDSEPKKEIKEEKPKRKRRSKEQIEADNAKEAENK